MILDEVGAYLAAAGVGIIGQTLFLGSMPQDEPGSGSQDAILAVREIPSRSPARAHDGTRYEIPSLQIETRGVPYDYPVARQKAQDAWDVLDGVTNQLLSGVRYLSITARRSVFWLRQDDQYRHHFVFDVECTRALP